MDRKLVRLSKFLSLILRHKPETIGMQLDPEGWLEIDELLQKANACGTPISLETLHEIVASSDRRRFTLSEDGLRIRANQGHSVTDVDLGLGAVEPPETLFHGTVAAFFASIQVQGLSKRSRQHIHLSADVATATKVAQRRGNPVVLKVAAFLSLIIATANGTGTGVARAGTGLASLVGRPILEPFR